MADREKIIEELERISEWLFQQWIVYDGDAPNNYDAYNTIDEAIELLKEQETEIRQLKLALDIATKGTCKGIKSGGGQFADMPTMQSAT